ncbi:probable G-protein coupled receptor 160 [Danio aesculapii]|uniref:probable G-protein coupled receptor 160 n=1 Tax=Danio aesculapii TaxID=1142201 RepID=UPI0024BFFDCB|nr:probable G-protein coupled receptor 160 [Danio aesculapii]
MLNQHKPPAVMMAIVWSPGTNDNFHHDETLQYLLILCTKVALNTFVLYFWRRSILKSLLGICSVSMYVADVLLVCAVSSAWILRENLPTSTSMCFILAHGSTIYALLPLPILIAGVFDYASYPNLDKTHCSRRRVVSYCLFAVLLWVSVIIYTYHSTNTQPTEIYKDNLKLIVCRVHGSTVVFQFSMYVLTVMILILLLHLKKLTGWVSRAKKLAKLENLTFLSDQDYSQIEESGNSEIPESSPPLFVSLTLGFAMNWVPYLLISVTCVLVDFAVPAYASVNLLWMACANSLMVGIAFWLKSDKIGPFTKFPDDTCFWKVYWHLSNESPITVDKTSLYVTIPIQKV